MRTHLTVLAGVFLTSCSGGDKVEPTQPLEALGGAEYVIGYGETVPVGGGLSLEFTTLAEESRCPVNVNCFWEGNGRILMTWRSPPRGEGVFELNTHSSRQTSAIVDSHSVTLRKLEPYPGTGPQTGAGSTPASGYEATVFVEPLLRHDSSQGP